ncbi:Carbamoyltransferase HypF [Sporomusa silvacetica DSM 10669]|uniref:Carbamoyltransferase n=1 Tax=Sporomusa silvacetica DSM 10669 TaxID=1123289 RepID=A0ABZ3IQN7_9FIRM|nr:carbamoyltransferase HypF [Sporomusa silvacetica]OZC20435.1 carbamoyltransferase HypF [Sporomusa silvacetica DSM 10669]
MMDIAVHIQITGIVQGVGFRPFVYNLARRYGVKGWVSNNASGVEIEVEGSQTAISGFLADLNSQTPPLAVVDTLMVKDCQLCGYVDFRITASVADKTKTALVSPDVATCSHCREELLNPADRRYRYPFINCTDCGPRFTIINDIPYDRQATTMCDFTMCPDCQAEYDNPANRRFHAQPNACPVCGPAYQLLDKEGRLVDSQEDDVFIQARKQLAAGQILAIKGIGGYHLAVNAFDYAAVARLRERKVREDKPFAVMAGSLAASKTQCLVSAMEEQLLTSAARPIVLLNKGKGYSLADSIAPGNPCVGMMLPYTPAHTLLLAPADIWVMTSGNLSDEPIAYQDNDVISRLNTIADYFLVHNRDIYCRADDSVVKVVFNKPYFFRRSRGYVPGPVNLVHELPPVLAVGGELKNTFCLTRGKQAFLSAHIGDLENLPTYQSYVEAIEHMQKLLAVTPMVVACDLHPEYLSTKYAQTVGLPTVAVQHHHAHIAAVMAEHHLAGPVIGLAFDGTGYGPDGTLWGGEFLVADMRQYRRAGHLSYLPLPGGAQAVRQPWRIAICLLKELYGEDFINQQAIPLVQELPAGWELVIAAAEKKINTPLSSGVGRLFDAAAALLGLRQSINYEGQAAIELELAAQGAGGRVLSYGIKELDGKWNLDFKPVFAALCQALQQGAAVGQLAADFHTTLAAATCDMTLKISKATGIREIALSGGVFQNITLLSQVIRMLAQHKLQLYLHRQVPPNDGGLALGQAVIAGEGSR